jgi:hypothetical protein
MASGAQTELHQFGQIKQIGKPTARQCPGWDVWYVKEHGQGATVYLFSVVSGPGPFSRTCVVSAGRTLDRSCQCDLRTIDVS